MRTPFVRVLLISAALLGCRASDENASQAALLQLSANRQKWDGEAIHDYSFDYDLAAMVLARPLHIEVRADTVNAVTNRESGALYPNAGNPTVDSLFARVAALIAHPDAGVRIQYNAALGFPESISSGSNIPDTGYTITITNLTRAP